jgi:hypothetical protein
VEAVNHFLDEDNRCWDRAELIRVEPAKQTRMLNGQTCSLDWVFRTHEGEVWRYTTEPEEGPRTVRLRGVREALGAGDGTPHKALVGRSCWLNGSEGSCDQVQGGGPAAVGVKGQTAAEIRAAAYSYATK